MAVYISYAFSRIIGNLCENGNEMDVFVKTCSALELLGFYQMEWKNSHRFAPSN